MGEMVDGVWRVGEIPTDESGKFKRQPTRFRNRPEAIEAGRYHLYVSYACPWAHRSLIVRALRGLEDVLSVTVVDPRMGDDGWAFAAGDPDPILGARFLRDVYLAAQASYTGRVTVPILWDRKRNTIVNNESREVMRILDVDFELLAQKGPSLAPPELRECIDRTLEEIYEPINNGVYKTGFATTQDAYESGCRELFDALDRWEAVLTRQRYLCGSVLTEADIALFTTLLRFDLVYYVHFKCNVKRIADYPALFGFLRDVYQTPGVRETCFLDHVKTHYYWSHPQINPRRIVPLGPTVSFDAPHGRENLSSG